MTVLCSSLLNYYYSCVGTNFIIQIIITLAPALILLFFNLNLLFFCHSKTTCAQKSCHCRCCGRASQEGERPGCSQRPEESLEAALKDEYFNS
jgi:hypothetical protein